MTVAPVGTQNGFPYIEWESPDGIRLVCLKLFRQPSQYHKGYNTAWTFHLRFDENSRRNRRKKGQTLSSFILTRSTHQRVVSRCMLLRRHSGNWCFVRFFKMHIQVSGHQFVWIKNGTHKIVRGCSSVVERSLRMREAPVSNPGTSRFFNKTNTNCNISLRGS